VNAIFIGGSGTYFDVADSARLREGLRTGSNRAQISLESYARHITLNG